MIGNLRGKQLLNLTKKYKRLFYFFVATLIFGFVFISLTKDSQALVSVFATVETTPVTHPPDAADDMAIWIHPADALLSTIIGTDKPGYL